jgi:hypothetical protein
MAKRTIGLLLLVSILAMATNVIWTAAASAQCPPKCEQTKPDRKP